MALFANEYQGGAFVELLSTQGNNPLVNWKVAGPRKDSVQKVYDKALRAYLYAVAPGGVSKLQIPREERAGLGLVQPFLVLQVILDKGQPFSMELGIVDTAGTRRRLLVSSSFADVKVTPLHCQIPFPSTAPRDAWLNVIVPLAELVPALFRSAEFRLLDTLTVGMGGGKLRKVFTLKDWMCDAGGDQHAVLSASPLPRGLEFQPSVQVYSYLVSAGGLAASGASGAQVSRLLGAAPPPRSGAAGHPALAALAVPACARSMDLDDDALSLSSSTAGPRSLEEHAAGHQRADRLSAGSGRVGLDHPPASRLGRSTNLAGSSAGVYPSASAGGRSWHPNASDPSGTGARPCRDADGTAPGQAPALPLGQGKGPGGLHSSAGGTGAHRQQGLAAGQGQLSYSGRRAVSAQLPSRLLTPLVQDPAGSPAGAPPAGGKPLSPPWPKAVYVHRAQSGPAGISTEHLTGGLGEPPLGGEGAPTSPGSIARHGRRAGRFTPGSSTINEQELFPVLSRTGSANSDRLVGSPFSKPPHSSGAPPLQAGPLSVGGGSGNNGRGSPALSPMRLRPQPRPPGAAPGAGGELMGLSGAVPSAGTGALSGGRLLSGTLPGDSGSGSGSPLGMFATLAASLTLGRGSGRDIGKDTRRECSEATLREGDGCGSGRDRDLLSLLQVRGGMEASVDLTEDKERMSGGVTTEKVKSLIASITLSKDHRYGRAFGTEYDDAADEESPDESSSTLPLATASRTPMASAVGGGPPAGLLSGAPPAASCSAPRTGNDLSATRRGGPRPTVVQLMLEGCGAGFSGTGGMGLTSPASGTAAAAAAAAGSRQLAAGTPLAQNASPGLTSSTDACSGTPGLSGAPSAPLWAGAPAATTAVSAMVVAAASAMALQTDTSSCPSPSACRRQGRGSNSVLTVPLAPPGSEGGLRELTKVLSFSRPGAAEERQRRMAASPTRQGRSSTRDASSPSCTRQQSAAGPLARDVPSPVHFPSPARGRRAVAPPQAVSPTLKDGAAGTAGSAAPRARRQVEVQAPDPPRGTGIPLKLPAASAAHAKALRHVRSRVSEVEDEELLARNGWDGFGVDEEDVLGSRHFRDVDVPYSGSDDNSQLTVRSGGGITTRRSTIAPLTEPAVSAAQSSLPRYASPPFRRNISMVNHQMRSSIDMDSGVLQGDVSTEKLQLLLGGTGSAAQNGLAAMLAPLAQQSPPWLPTTQPTLRQNARQADGTLPIELLLQGAGREDGARYHHRSSGLLQDSTVMSAPPAGADGTDGWGDDIGSLTSADMGQRQRLHTPPIVVPSKLLAGSAPQAVGAAQMLKVEAGRTVQQAPGGDPMLELLYDPLLNCYYDQKTAQYYELKA